MKLSAPLALALSLPSAAAFTSLCDPTSASNADYTTTFSDNFSGDTLDESSWTITEGYEVGQTRDSWGTAANVEVADGKLILTSDREASNGYNFTTGAITSTDKMSWKPPFKACVAALLPGDTNDPSTTHGVWPAIWMMPDSKGSPAGSTCWPDGGEIDLMEQIDGINTIYSTYHFNPNYDADNNPKPCDGGHEQVGVSSSKFSDPLSNYHEYAVDAQEEELNFYVDGELIGTVKIGDKGEREGAQMPGLRDDIAWHLILNTAISEGGEWPQPVDDDTAFPLKHFIDYARVMQPK